MVVVVVVVVVCVCVFSLRLYVPTGRISNDWCIAARQTRREKKKRERESEKEEVKAKSNTRKKKKKKKKTRVGPNVERVHLSSTPHFGIPPGTNIPRHLVSFAGKQRFIMSSLV